MKSLPRFHNLDMYGCRDTGLPYMDGMSGTPADGRDLPIVERRGAVRTGSMKGAAGATAEEAGARMNGTMLLTAMRMDTDMGTHTDTTDNDRLRCSSSDVETYSAM